MCNKTALKGGINNYSLSKTVPIVKLLLQELGVFAAPIKTSLLTQSVSTALSTVITVSTCTTSTTTTAAATSTIVNTSICVTPKAYRPGDVVNVLRRCWPG